MKRITLICTVILFASLSFAIGQVSATKSMEIYLLMGQSNMAGRGPITEEQKNEGNDNVFVLNQDMKWVLARHPLHFDKPSVAGVGPGLTFGIQMAKAHHGVKIGLVPCAVGGTPIEHWIPGAYDTATKTHPYDDAVARIKEAMKYGVVKGVIWHQGESNSSVDKASLYLQQIAELISRIRDLVGNPNLPFVAGQIGEFHKNAEFFNAQIVKLPQTVKGTAVVTTESLAHKGDHLHFDGPSAQELGRRYANKFIALENNK
ncbi:sialate O-acetylesterase [Mucilaginibacter sp. PAMB04274]|uniref:sialate O-acetylesterase n=1 Tax=Mucilaginibacter sp. PAMB04274 TaxID=3138568 RepID=UPI0031F62582